MRFKTFSIIVIILSLKCANEKPSPISNLKPVSIGDLAGKPVPYFAFVDYDIAKAEKSIKRGKINKDARKTYDYMMKYKTKNDSQTHYDSTEFERQQSFKSLGKKKTVDSILIPDYTKMEIENNLFMEFANKPYFDTTFSEPVCSPDSTSMAFRYQMREQLKVLNDSNILNNFDNIKFGTNPLVFYLPVGLLLVRHGNAFCWYIPIGWEYRSVIAIKKKDEEIPNDEQCNPLGHILGYIYNFDFSEKLYEFKCM